MQRSSDAVAAGIEGWAKPSGCIITRDRSSLLSYGPLGDELSSILCRPDQLDPGSGDGLSQLVEAIEKVFVDGQDTGDVVVDLESPGLGRRVATLQKARPAAGNDLLVNVSIAPEIEMNPAVAHAADHGVRLDLLLDLVPAVAFVVDADDRLVYLNRGAAALFQFESTEMLGRRPNELFGSGDVRRDILLSGNDAARAGGYKMAEISATQIGVAMIRMHKSSLEVRGEQVVAAIGVNSFESTVARSRSSEREVQLGRLVDLIPAAIWVISPNRRIIRLNEAARALATTTTTHLVGARVDAAYPDTAAEVFGSPEAAFASLATAGGPAQIYVSSDKERVFRVDRTLLPGKDSPGSAMAVMLTDLSEVYGAQEELRIKNEVLEHRNAELDQFAHMASHDLRAPLRAIYAFTQMALEEEGDEHRDHMGAILGSVDRMRSVLDSLLEFATADTRPMFQEVALADVVTSVLDDLASDIAESGAKIKVGELPVLQCDETSMRRLFQNLIANAISYAGDDAPSITITSTPEYRFVEIVVTDRGIGFAQDQEDDVFRPFKRLSADSVGQGIGLSMCRRIVEAHHGTIRAISQVGGPTSLVIRLPRRRMG